MNPWCLFYFFQSESSRIFRLIDRSLLISCNAQDYGLDSKKHRRFDIFTAHNNLIYISNLFSVVADLPKTAMRKYCSEQYASASMATFSCKLVEQKTSGMTSLPFSVPFGKKIGHLLKVLQLPSSDGDCCFCSNENFFHSAQSSY